MFSRETYQTRRKNLQAKLGTGLVLLLGNSESPMNYADNCYPFRQDSSFLYFFGLDQPDLAAVIAAAVAAYSATSGPQAPVAGKAGFHVRRIRRIG